MKKNIILFFGGQSAEHEISVISAQNIFSAMCKKKYEVFCVGISRKGHMGYFSHEDFAAMKRVDEESVLQNPLTMFMDSSGFFINIMGEKTSKRVVIHLAFPVLHGPMGEDGAIQGWLESFNIPYVGNPVLASALSMNKALTKTIALANGIPVIPFSVLRKGEHLLSYDDMMSILDSKTLFVKPNALGSSVGMAKVSSSQEYTDAVKDAFLYGDTVIVEKFMRKRREFECAVLGNISLQVSGVVEVKCFHAFYSYSAKYLDPDSTDFFLPAPISQELCQEIRKRSREIFRLLECQGMARVDFIMDEDNDRLYFNEVNTIPGFTSISCYPKLFLHEGISYEDLIQKLLDLAEERFSRWKKFSVEHDVTKDLIYYPSKEK